MNDTTPKKTKSIASTVLLVALAVVYLLFQKKIDGLLGINKPDKDEQAVATAEEKPTQKPPATDQGRTQGETQATAAPKVTRRQVAGQEEPAQSVLTKKGRDYVSAAGLVYTPGGREHRRDHVLLHAKDNMGKPVHGVFDDKNEVFALVDEAYKKVKKKSRDVQSRKEPRNRMSHTVKMGRRIGYKGGSEGKRRGNPPLSRLKIVLEGNRVITAFPY